MTPKTKRAAASAAAILLLLSFAGCSSSGQRQSQPRSRPQAGTRPAVPARVILDGQTAEWPDGVASLADPNFIYFKVGLESETDLLHSPATTTLLLDADGRINTGLRGPGAQSSLGVDLEVQFSPPGGQGGGGATAFAIDATGARTPLTPEQIGLQVAPSYSSQWYEVRVSRLPWAAPALTEAMAGSSSGRTMLQLTENGAVVGWSDPEVFPKPTAAKVPAMFDAGVAAKQTGDLRIVSWNVSGPGGMGGPETNARPFANVLTTLSPDIILIQGWKSDAATLQAWCTALVTGEGEWYARSLPEAGVGIISRFPIDALGDPLSAATESGAGPRFIAGMVHTPVGDAAVASVSLVPGGGDTESMLRDEQAAAVNRALKSAMSGHGPGLRVIGGDLNLTGRGPLDALRAGLDDDGTDLTAAEAFVLGDSVLTTRREPGGLPSRADYIVYSDAFATPTQSLTFDTTRLTEGALARIGLDRGDTGVSEHLPIVVDLRARTP